jgi:glycine/D-amino acid oxidase-like deaminating enzyme
MRVVGAGVYGASAALELARRGHRVQLWDPGPLPHELAASTDISKVVRADYGGDVFYTQAGEAALEGWRAWNSELFERELFHEEGFLILSARRLETGSFEHASRALLSSRGHTLEPLDASRFAHWRGVADGYRNPSGGWVESGAAVAGLVRAAAEAGVELVEQAATAEQIRAWTRAGERTLVAAGAWTSTLLPELADRLRPIGQPVHHLRPPDPEAWRAPRFPVWACDIGTTGWYGFPANADGLLKIANHGEGVLTDPRGPRDMPADAEARLRSFLARHLPEALDFPIVGTRLCLYSDSFDGDFWIDRHPEHPDLFVSAGGSGHGLKFGPLLGGWAADVIEGAPALPRFSWRALGDRKTEEARNA